jgi:YD repeat-containing protein
LFIRPDGSRLYFRGGQSYSTPDTSSPTGTATLTSNADGSYTLRDEDARILTFSSQGALQTIKDSHGIGWTLTRPDGNTVVVTHTNGQSFRLVVVNGSSVYGTAKQIQVTDPASNVYLYDATTSAYDQTATPVSQLGNLNKVTLPGSPSTVISYTYYPDEPSSAGSTVSKFMQLNGVYYNGVAHDTTTYDSAGRATVSSLADGKERTSVIYGSNSTGPTATVTNPLNHVSVYQYDGAGNLVSITGDSSVDCPATLASMSYDANGFMTSSTDNNGTVTNFTYNAGGLLQQKIEAVGTSIQRTTDYVWDTSTTSEDRLLSVTVEGWSKTEYTYDAQNRLATVKVTNLSGVGTNQTLVTTYGYTLYANGMVHTMTVAHPSPNSTNTDTFTYDVLGNLASATDGLNHSASYSNYNGLGEVGRVTGPNGDITDYGYDPRGRIYTKTTYPNGTAAVWTYAYDGFGLVYSETAPDARVTTWNRDADMRVTSIVRNDKDGTSTEGFGYDDNGDVTSHTVSRGGVVSFSEIRSYDSSGRLYQRQGMHGQQVSYTYDGNGNVVSVTDAMGHVVTNQYDALNRLTRTTSSGGASPLVPGSAPVLSAPANSTSGSYSVTWGAISDATSYTVQAQVNGGGWNTVQTSGATSFVLSNQASGTYEYQVRACNTTGCSPWSGTATVVVTYITGTIDGLHFDGDGSASVVGWACSAGLPQSINVDLYVGGQAGTGTGIGRYTANLSSEAAVASACNVSSGSYRFAIPLSASLRSQYVGQTIYIHGISPVGSGNPLIANSGKYSVPVNEPAGAPSLSTPGTSTTGNYTVVWSAVTDATSYTLQEQVGSAGAWSTVQTGAGLSWAASGKGNGTYGYQVQACDASGCGPWSVAATTVVALPPATAPTVSVPATSNTGSYSVSWNTVATATSYELREQMNGGVWTTIQTGAGVSMAISGKGNGTYGYQSRACNSSGCTSWGAVGSVVVTHPPASAPIVTVPTSSTSGSYTVSWAAISTATSYNLQEQINGGAWTTIQSGSDTSRAVSGKANGTYGYHAQACNAGGCTGWGTAGSISVLHVPPTPTGLSSTVYATYYSDTRPPRTIYEIYGSWSASSGATSYDFQYCNSAGSCTTATTSATTIDINPIPTGSYTANVRACNASGCSAWSATVTPPVVNQ